MLTASCLHYQKQTHLDTQPGQRHNTTGYLLSGLAIAGVHAVGFQEKAVLTAAWPEYQRKRARPALLTSQCDSYVENQSISQKERNLRDYAFWNVFILDVVSILLLVIPLNSQLRAIAAGRQPMLTSEPEIVYPEIDAGLDSTPWFAPFNHLSSMSVTGTRSMRSTVFHWQAKLMVIACSILETLYSPGSRNSRSEAGMTRISLALESWYRELPVKPVESSPLPHVILLHMTYDLLAIFVHRPFYRSSLPDSSAKCDAAALSIIRLLQVWPMTYLARLMRSCFTILTRSNMAIII